MKQDRKQRGQLIALGVLVVLFVGFLSFQYMGTNDSPASTPENSSAADGSVEASSDDGVAAGQTELVGDLLAKGVFPGISEDLPRRDPFLMQPMPNAGPTVQELAPQKVSPAPRTNHAARPDFGSENVPPISLRPMNPFTGGATSPESDAARISVVEPREKFTVTGVVRGDNNVAIVYDDAGGRHVVKEGQSIGGQYRLISVGRDGVVLSHKKQTIHLKLGGAKDAG